MIASTVDMKGKVVICTGANCGIGYEASLELARLGATVVLACRDLTKANEAKDKIVAETKSENVHVEQLDLASLESVRNFSSAFKAKFDKLDVLINNAGLSGIGFQLTKDGFETQFGVMHLGHFYLTFNLIDWLKKSAPSRIINVSSAAHTMGKIKWDSFKSDKGYSGFGAYAQAKLANVLFTNELAKRYQKDNITSVSLHPGVVRTEIYRELKGNWKAASVFFYLIQPVFNLFSKDSREGAATTVFCATDPSIPQQNDCKPKQVAKAAQDVETARKLWDVSEELLGIKFD